MTGSRRLRAIASFETENQTGKLYGSVSVGEYLELDQSIRARR